MIRNRHLAEWRFLLFTMIVTVNRPICNVIRIAPPPFGMVQLTACRFVLHPGTSAEVPTTQEHGLRQTARIFASLCDNRSVRTITSTKNRAKVFPYFFPYANCFPLSVISVNFRKVLIINAFFCSVFLNFTRFDNSNPSPAASEQKLKILYFQGVLSFFFLSPSFFCAARGFKSFKSFKFCVLNCVLKNLVKIGMCA